MEATFSLTLIFLALNLFIGLAAGKDITDFKSFVLSRGYFGKFALVATITATFIGGGMIIGNAEKTYVHGSGYLIAVLGACVQFIVAAKFLNPKIVAFKSAITIGDFVVTAYGKGAKFLIGLCWVLFCTGLVTTQFLALGKVLWVFLGLDLNFSIILGAAIVIFYCYYGGIRSVIMTDIAQFIFMILTIPLLCYVAVNKHSHFSEFISSIPLSHTHIFGTLSPTQVIILFATFFMGEALFPPYVQRILIADKTHISTSTTYWSALLATFLCVCGGFLGIITYSLNPSLAPSEVLHYLFFNTLNPFIQSLAIIGLSSVIMSSVDSNLNSVAATMVYDIIQPIHATKRKKISDASFLMLARITTIIIGFLSMVLAIYLEKLPILNLLMLAYKFWAPIVLVPIVATLFSYKVSKVGFYLSSGIGALCVIIWEFFNIKTVVGIDSFIPGIIVNLMIFTLFYWNGKRHA